MGACQEVGSGLGDDHEVDVALGVQEVGVDTRAEEWAGDGTIDPTFTFHAIAICANVAT